MNIQTPVPTINFGKYIEKYIALRAKKKEVQDRHKAELAPYNEWLEKLEGELLRALDATGQDSAKSEFGTAYRTTKKSASLKDPALFLEFVIKQEAWDMMDKKANATAVEDYIEEHGVEPPGVEFTRSIEIGVMSPRKK